MTGNVERGSAGSDVHTERGELVAQVRQLTKRVADLEAELRTLRDRQLGGNAGPRFAALYDDFTNRFRGSTDDITAKLAGYLPDVRRLVRDGGVVDVGSGRGEWLRLLHDAGVRACGVDTNPAFVVAARGRGLRVELDDAVAYLNRLPARTVDLVTAFHVIEHLDTEAFLALLEAAHCALRPGGGILLETPNPANLVMAACDFYNDPTHRAPLPAALTEYLVSATGFTDVEVRPLHPSTQEPRPPDGTPAALWKLLTSFLFGAQDYAVLGYKPGADRI